MSDKTQTQYIKQIKAVGVYYDDHFPGANEKKELSPWINEDDYSEEMRQAYKEMLSGTILSFEELRRFVRVDLKQSLSNDNTQQVVDLLKEYGWKMSAAESCTAGLFVSEIASVPGASEVLDMSFVTYSEDAKSKLVGVAPDIIQKHGVVSEEVAIQMAIGAAMQAHAEVGVGITGYAGPTGGDDKASVGTICIGLYIDGTVFYKTLHADVSKGRNVVRQEIVNNVMEILSKRLENFRPYYQTR